MFDRGAPEGPPAGGSAPGGSATAGALGAARAAAVPPPGDPGTVGVHLEGLCRELKELSAIDVGALDPDELAELNVGLARVEAMVGAQVARAADALRDSPVLVASGARSTKAWLAHTTGRSLQACGRTVRLGRLMAKIPEAGAAWEAGEITTDHLRDRRETTCAVAVPGPGVKQQERGE